MPHSSSVHSKWVPKFDIQGFSFVRMDKGYQVIIFSLTTFSGKF